ncbi:MAG: ABC transporter ATP-binding protein [Myxococcales bacterium]|nr:ABC transporter ATP-binding protein [Myxococcales bacterium]
MAETPSSQHPILEANALTVSVASRQLFSRFTMSLPQGQALAILGPNGSGKTTVLRALAGLVQPESGSVSVAGHELSTLARLELAKRISYMPQRTPSSFPSAAIDFVLLGRNPHLRGFGFASSEDRADALACMKELEVDSLALRAITALSGGELQRLCLAQALIQDADLLLLDEPTSAQDPRGRGLMMAALKRRLECGKSCVVAVHDLNLAVRFFQHFVVLRPSQPPLVVDIDGLRSERVLDDVFEVEFRWIDGPDGPLLSESDSMAHVQ